ncbi:hypothetical protein J7K44_02045 [bacterium]|nr:hypothetical protein [bacterium]
MTIKEVLEKYGEILTGVEFMGCNGKIAKELEILKRVFRAKYKNRLRNSRGIKEFLKRYGNEMADPEVEERIISLYHLLSF